MSSLHKKATVFLKSKDHGFAVLVMNILWPGLGTVVAGCLAGRGHVGTNLLVGFLQGITAPVIVGWVWSIMLGLSIYKLSKGEEQSKSYQVLIVQDPTTSTDANELVVIACPYQISEIFGKYSKLVTKHERSKTLFHGIVPDCFLFEDSRAPTFPRRKKAIMGIFTKEVKAAIAGIMFKNCYEKIMSWVG